MYLTPAAAHVAISAARIGREASEMSVSPLQKRLNPPPVPEMPTVTRTLPRFWIWYSSATASVIGNTVLEPSTLMVCAPTILDAVRASRPAPTHVAAIFVFMIFPALLKISTLMNLIRSPGCGPSRDGGALG